MMTGGMTMFNHVQPVYRLKENEGLTVIADVTSATEDPVGVDGRVERHSADVERVARISAYNTLKEYKLALLSGVLAGRSATYCDVRAVAIALVERNGIRHGCVRTCATPGFSAIIGYGG